VQAPACGSSRCSGAAATATPPSARRWARSRTSTATSAGTFTSYPNLIPCERHVSGVHGSRLSLSSISLSSSFSSISSLSSLPSRPPPSSLSSALPHPLLSLLLSTLFLCSPLLTLFLSLKALRTLSVSLKTCSCQIEKWTSVSPLNVVFVTNDNPRNEDPYEILNDVVDGFRDTIYAR